MANVKVFTLKLDKEVTHVHKFDEDLYYIEDTTGIYKMHGEAEHYVDYLKNKGWEVQHG